MEPSKGGFWPKKGISSACDRLRPLATVGTPTKRERERELQQAVRRETAQAIQDFSDVFGMELQVEHWGHELDFLSATLGDIRGETPIGRVPVSGGEGAGRGGGGGGLQPPSHPAAEPPSHPATLSPSHPTV